MPLSEERAHSPHTHGFGTLAFMTWVVAVSLFAAFGGPTGPNSVEYNEARLWFLVLILIASVGAYCATECDTLRGHATSSSVRTNGNRGREEFSAASREKCSAASNWEGAALLLSLLPVAAVIDMYV